MYKGSRVLENWPEGRKEGPRMAGECVSRGSEACGVRGWRSFTDTKKVAGVGVWDQKRRMYEVWGLGQDPSERVQWIGWNTASGLLTIS